MMSNTYVAIICGSRNVKETRDNMIKIDNVCVENKFDILEVISGGAKGGDSLGETWASYHNIDLTIMPANWDRHGKAAGHIRNRRMLNYILNHPDKFIPLVIALWDGKSRGTKGMIGIAKSANVIVEVVMV